MRDQVILEFLAMPALTAQRLLDYDGDSAPPAAVYDPWTGHAPSLQIWSFGDAGRPGKPACILRYRPE